MLEHVAALLFDGLPVLASSGLWWKCKSFLWFWSQMRRKPGKITLRICQDRSLEGRFGSFLREVVGEFKEW